MTEVIAREDLDELAIDPETEKRMLQTAKVITPSSRQEARDELKRKMDEFLAKGGKVRKRGTGESGVTKSPEQNKAAEASRKRMAMTVKTIKPSAVQIETMAAIQRLADMPNAQITRQGLKNILRIQLNALNSRLALLEKKGYIRCGVHHIELLARLV